jgi:hypothetical protein
MSPAWVLDVFAALMLVVAALSAVRLTAARLRHNRPAAVSADVAHLLMAIAMAGMLAASLATLPGTAWEVAFWLLTAWFAWQAWLDARVNGARALAGGHWTPHLVHSGAMLYMLLALTTPAGGAGMGGMGGMAGPAGTATQALKYPALAFAFALILAGYSVWDLDHLSGRRYALAGAGAPSVTSDSVTATASVVDAGADQDFPGKRPDSPGVRALLLSSGTTVGCRVVMGVTMAFMLIIML